MVTKIRIAGAVALSTVALLVGGCASFTPFAPPKATKFTEDQIVGALTNPVTPKGYVWEPGGDDANTVAEVGGDTSDWWNKNAGTPADCYDVYAASSLTSRADRDATRDEPDFAIGRFNDDKAGDRYSLLGVSARLFASSEAAKQFVDGLSKAVSNCADGYTLTSKSGTFWTTESLELRDDAGLGRSNVRAVTLEERVTDDSAAAGYRTVFLMRGNAVVSLIAEVTAGKPVRFDEQNDIAKAISEALSRLSSNS